VNSNFSSTIKLLLRNDSSTTVKIERGTSLVQALIIPVLHPTLIHESVAHSYSMKMDDNKSKDSHPLPDIEDTNNSSSITSE
jgi:hypothetical protein